MKPQIFTLFMVINLVLNSQVTSVGISAPGSVFSISGSPVTTTGTLTLNFVTQTEKTFFAGPTTSPAAAPSFRTILATDLPYVSASTEGIVSTNTASTQVLGDGDKEFPDLAFFTLGGETSPSIGFAANHGSGFSYLNTPSKILSLSIDGAYKYQFLSGEFNMKDGTNFASGANKLSINITHDSNINGQDGGVSVSTYGGTTAGAGNRKCATFGGRTSSGTEAIPTNTIADQRLAEFIGKGYTTDWESDNRGVFGIYAAEDHIGSAQGAYCKIRTTRLLTDQAHNSLLVDPAGNAGLSNNTTIPQTFPAGWSGATDYDSRFFTIESFTTTASDAGLFIQNSNGTRGINLWFDNSANVNYIDNIRNSNTNILQTRFKTATGPVISMTTGLFDVGGSTFVGGTNFGTDASPDNVLTVGSTSQFQVDGNGIIVKYNNIPTVGNGVPAIYDVEQATAQTAQKTATTFFTTAATDGYYRINWVCTITTAATTSSILGPFQILYTGATDNTVKTWPSGNINNFNQCATNNTGSGVVSGCMTVYAKASTNFQFAIGYTSAGGTAMIYDYHITTEKL